MEPCAGRNRTLPVVIADGLPHLQSASATFTPAFQSLIPSVLPDTRDYTRALSLARLAYDLEALVSPIIAAALLTVVTYNNLFLGTALGFASSAVLVLITTLPHLERDTEPSSVLCRSYVGASSRWDGVSRSA